MRRREGRRPGTTRFVGATIGLALLAACSPAPAPKPSPSAAAQARVADYFSPPAPHPGPAWTKDTRTVRPEELQTSAGPGHCDWQSATFLSLGWPVGTIARRATEARRFVRDPGGVVSPELRDALAKAADLPADARDTGYRNGDLALWLSPSDPESVYLRVADDVERWPRADQMVCS